VNKGNIAVLASVAVAPLTEYAPEEAVVFGLTLGIIMGQENPAFASSMLDTAIDVLTGTSDVAERNRFKTSTRSIVPTLAEAATR